MELTVGNSYLACQPAEEFYIDETEKVEFPEKKLSFCVLDKPERVIAMDGLHSEEIKLPEHLKSKEWYFVKNLKTDKQHWLNSTVYQISKTNN